MQIVVGSDEPSALLNAVVAELNKRGHEVTQVKGDWVDVGSAVGNGVARGRFDQGVAICWTGTGVSIAANKVPGVRAALCSDGPTAAGARQWNDANVLALSNRTTTPALAVEILTAWLHASPEPTEAEVLAKLPR